MNRKFLLPTVLLLIILMAGSALTATVKAEGTRPDQYNPLCIWFEASPIYLSVDEPYVYSYGDVWQEGNMLYIRGLVVAAEYEMNDEYDNSLPGVAYITIYSDVNLQTSQASTYLLIILDNDYGWWYGEVDVDAAWIDNQLYVDMDDEIPLYGAGGCWAWNIWVTLDLGDELEMNGVMYNPVFETWCPIIPT